jgi:hypothetical protein
MVRSEVDSEHTLHECPLFLQLNLTHISGGMATVRLILVQDNCINS